ncbi:MULTISPECIES: formyltetrahydrofolate deformylase [Chitinophagaceae]|uniref:formyltetrahydrofolate deformylase n=1 Tax=Chitinophagaceae TaxID=563835 RepID=UPI000DEFC634|nr:MULTISPECIES: formyltetrahydrofolate deformylase [Chitinophagaceae]RPD51474.1 formyltetrahydrofolate deformylase [Paracnuella aquatica]
MATHVLLIQCPDRPGLIATITGILFQHQLNIISNDEFVERKGNWFFMRTEFSGNTVPEPILQELREALPAEAVIQFCAGGNKKIVVLASKEHHCLADLLVRHHYNELGAEILAVIANHESLQPLVQKFDLPFHYVPHEGPSREEHEQAIAAIIDQYEYDFVVLAKYMRILSPQFVARYPNKIINIHHSFLPAFVGAKPYAQAYERGVKIIGATAHFVNNQLDEGPIIAQSIIPVNHTHGAKEMQQAGRDVEQMVLAKALRLVFHERVFVYGNKTVIFD